MTVIRLGGKTAAEFLMADLTRSLASSTALSGRPTIKKDGSPEEMSTSTSTGSASRPTTAAEVILDKATNPSYEN